MSDHNMGLVVNMWGMDLLSDARDGTALDNMFVIAVAVVRREMSPNRVNRPVRTVYV